jgi:hypothetical protein
MLFAANVPFQNLSNLNLNACREITEQTIINFSYNLKNLERIELYWNCRITDFAVKKMAKACPILNFVNLSGCKHLSDSSISVVVESCPKITHFNITRLPKLTDKGVEKVANAGLNLTYLNMYANSEIGDNAFKALALNSACHNLEFLDLCGCKNLSDDSLVELCKSFPKLTYLNLPWCISLNDKAIVDGVAKHLPKITLLGLFGLVRISDASIDALLDSPCKLSLETLDINGCCLVTKGDGDSIREMFPNVTVTVWAS